MAGSVILLAGSIALMIWSWQLREEASAWVQQSGQVQMQIEQMLSDLKDLERDARDFAILRDRAFLDNCEAAGARAETRIAPLLALSAGDPVLHEHALELAELVRQKRQIVGRFIGHVIAGQPELAVEQIRVGPGRQVMGRIRQLGSEMLSREHQRIAGHIAALQRAKRHQIRTSVAIGVAEVLLVAAALYCARRVRDLRQLVTICAWTKQVRHNGEWMSVEQYLWQVHHIRVSHGLSPKQAKALRAEMENLDVADLPSATAAAVQSSPPAG